MDPPSTASQTDGPPTSPGAVRPDPLAPYIRWARFLFLLLVAVAIIGLALVATAGGFEPGLLAGAGPALIVAVLGVVITLTVLIGVIRGLGARRPWALHAVAPICAILIVYGLGRALVALGRSEFLFPLEAIGALLVLSRPHGPDLLPQPSDVDRRRVLLATGAIAVAFVTPVVLSLLAP